jgi:hypothetical protein
MSDPNFTDPRNRPRPRDEPYDPSAIGPWGWVAGIVVMAVIALILGVADQGAVQNTASNTLAPTGMNSPPRNITPHGTTGMGSPQPFPSEQRPAARSNKQ